MREEHRRRFHVQALRVGNAGLGALDRTGLRGQEHDVRLSGLGVLGRGLVQGHYRFALVAVGFSGYTPDILGAKILLEHFEKWVF